MRLLNSIDDEIGNRSFACWFCLDFSLEITVQTNRLKGMYKGDRRKEVFRLSGRQKHMHMASYAPQLPSSVELTFTLPPKNKEKRLPSKITAVLHYHQTITAVLLYRRKSTAIFWFTASAKVVTVEK